MVKRIKPKVVFVLGAGASCEYGDTSAARPDDPRRGMLPTAAELKRLIVRSPSVSELALDGEESPFDGENPQVQYRERLVRAIASQFSKSGLISIDRFLERRPEYQKDGKHLIAHALLKLEEGALRDRSIASGWYHWLFNEITDHNGLFQNAKGLEFITFNYDRTLEYALRTMMINAFGSDEDKVEGEIGPIRIRHVYGELKSPLVFSKELYCYEARSLRGAVGASAQALKIISEGRDDSLDDLADTMNSATAVIFLGFGYDETNLRRLGILPNPGGRKRTVRGVPVFASAYGLGDKELATHQTRLEESSMDGWTVQLGGKQMKSTEFLREKVDLRELLTP